MALGTLNMPSGGDISIEIVDVTSFDVLLCEHFSSCDSVDSYWEYNMKVFQGVVYPAITAMIQS